MNNHPAGTSSLIQNLVQDEQFRGTPAASYDATSSSHAGPTSTSTRTITENSAGVGGLATTSTEALDYPDHLVCSICLDLLLKPIRVNPCGHVFCERCVRRYVETFLSKITCPLCREIIVTCQPAEERSREVLQKYPTQLAERQKLEQNNNGPELSPQWLHNYRFQTSDDAEANRSQPTTYVDHNTRWRSALWIFWVGAIGFLMVFSLNSFINQAIHGGDPHQLPSHPHLSTKNDALSSIILLDGREVEGLVSPTHATSTGDTTKYNSGDLKISADYGRNYSVSKNNGIRSEEHFYHDFFYYLNNFGNTLKGFANVLPTDVSSFNKDKLKQYSAMSTRKPRSHGRNVITLNYRSVRTNRGTVRNGGKVP